VVSHKQTAIEIVGISDVFHVDCTRVTGVLGNAIVIFRINP
jgi:hypothetical protein